jgi:chaperonin cofactor prefoldin|tara:strand:+ start:359 stop:514 length:156 start_codon:yes stop_codon:yes gene_type:complete
MSDSLEQLEARVAKLEKQMFNVNREIESGPVSLDWEQSGQGSKPAPPTANE